jgi:hypothetical protein
VDVPERDARRTVCVTAGRVARSPTATIRDGGIVGNHGNAKQPAHHGPHNIRIIQCGLECVPAPAGVLTRREPRRALHDSPRTKIRSAQLRAGKEIRELDFGEPTPYCLAYFAAPCGAARGPLWRSFHTLHQAPCISGFVSSTYIDFEPALFATSCLLSSGLYRAFAAVGPIHIRRGRSTFTYPIP